MGTGSEVVKPRAAKTSHTVTKTVRLRTHKCPQCKHVFHYPSGVTRHIKAAHTVDINSIERKESSDPDETIDANGERWRKIAEFPNYSVSNKGNVRNDVKGMTMSLVNHGGCFEVKLYNTGKCRSPRVQLLQATAFLVTPKCKKFTVDHIDRDPYNNELQNLRWATKKQQQLNRSMAYTNKVKQPLPVDLEWRAIPANKVRGTEGYEISDKGAWIRFVGDQSGMRRDERQPCLNKTTGYTLHSVGNKTYRAHLLVAAAFLSKPAEGLIVDHIDEVKHNNDVTNLRYVTPSENGKHSKIVGKAVTCHLTKEGPVIKTFKSISEAAKTTNSWRTRIVSCCSEHGSSTWSKKDDTEYFWRTVQLNQ
jgi:hypothetical protein